MTDLTFRVKAHEIGAELMDVPEDLRRAASALLAVVGPDPDHDVEVHVSASAEGEWAVARVARHILPED